VSGQLHVMVTLPLGKVPQYSLNCTAWWFPVTV